MLSRQSFYKIAICIVIIGFLVASFILTPRVSLESSNRTVGMAVRMTDVVELLRVAGKESNDIEVNFDRQNDLLKRYRKAGANLLVVQDATLDSLARTGAVELTVNSGSVIAKEVHSNIFDEVIASAVRRYGDAVKVRGEVPHRQLEITGKTTPVDIHVKNPELAVQQLPLGIMSHELKRFHGAGFGIIVAPHNYENLDELGVNALFTRINKSKVPVFAFMPNGQEVFGNSSLLGSVAKQLAWMHLVLQEHYTQLGFYPYEGQIRLAELRNYDVLRAYTIDYHEMQKLTPEQALRRWALADDERNIRLNIVQPFLKGEGDLLQLNVDYVQKIVQQVQDRGFTIGLARPFETYYPYRVLMIPVIAAISAAVALLLQLLFGLGTNLTWILWGLITGLGQWGNFVMATQTHQIAALCAAVTFPVLSVYRITDMLDDLGDISTPKIIANGVISIVLCTVFSLLGACLLAAVLTDARFLLEIDFYRGVKLTFILPLVLMLILYMKKYDMLGLRECNTCGEYCHCFADNLKKVFTTFQGFCVFLALLAFVCAVLYVFIGRTGHSWAVPVPEWELSMRYWLEEHLYVRPREKEFLVGHVAFFLMVMGVHKSWPRFVQLLMTIGAVIGQTTLVETFCHMRTPFLMSLARGGIGLVLGIILGALAVLLIAQFDKIWEYEDEDDETQES